MSRYSWTKQQGEETVHRYQEVVARWQRSLR
jgi:hypothetical protein